MKSSEIKKLETLVHDLTNKLTIVDSKIKRALLNKGSTEEDLQKAFVNN